MRSLFSLVYRPSLHSVKFYSNQTIKQKIQQNDKQIIDLASEQVINLIQSI